MSKGGPTVKQGRHAAGSLRIHKADDRGRTRVHICRFLKFLSLEASFHCPMLLQHADNVQPPRHGHRAMPARQEPIDQQCTHQVSTRDLWYVW